MSKLSNDFPKHWLYAPGANADQWERFSDQQIMGLGWAAAGNFLEAGSRSDLQKQMQERIDPRKSFAQASGMAWQFAHEIKPGDIIYAKKGKHTIVGKGIVTSDYQYDPKDPQYPHIRQVRWLKKGEWAYPSSSSIPIKTLTELKDEKIIQALDQKIDAH